MSRITQARREYERDLHRFLNRQSNEALINMRNSATSHHRRRACEAVMKHRGMNV